MYSINVVIVSYRQEDVIGRAIDSILCQKEYGLNKIIICDDGSDDGTWDVISQYKEKYPDLIVSYRNEKNRGRSMMYHNFEKAESLRGEADLYCDLSGDDALCEGWFKAVQESICQQKIDVKNEAITIFSDWKCIFPNGREFINRTNKLAVVKELDLKSLKVRGLVCGRSSLSSAKVHNRYKNIILDEGLALAEWMFDYRKFQYTDKAFYCNYVGSIYYASVGISTDLGTDPSYYADFIYSCKRRKEEYIFNKKDSLFFDYRCAKYSFLIDPTLKNYFRVIYLYVTSFDYKYSKYSFVKEIARVALLPFKKVRK